MDDAPKPIERATAAPGTRLVIRQPDDWHVHLRDGQMLKACAPYTARQFARAIVMPNLVPPVTTVTAAIAYRTRIVEALPAGDLRTLIDRTRFAISTEETRYYLNGIYLHAAKQDGVDVLRAVATDGHRLARVEMALPEGAAGMPGVISPTGRYFASRTLIRRSISFVAVNGGIRVTIS